MKAPGILISWMSFSVVQIIWQHMSGIFISMATQLMKIYVEYNGAFILNPLHDEFYTSPFLDKKFDNLFQILFSTMKQKQWTRSWVLVQSPMLCLRWQKARTVSSARWVFFFSYNWPFRISSVVGLADTLAELGSVKKETKNSDKQNISSLWQNKMMWVSKKAKSYSALAKLISSRI